jgi:hypothetical protein
MPTFEDADDAVQPRRKTAKQLGVCTRTITRWEQNPQLGFPPCALINGRKYDRVADVLRWVFARAAGKRTARVEA